MKRNKAKKQKIKEMGLYLYSRKIKPRQVVYYNQVSARAKYFQIIANSLVKQKDQKKVLQNLSKTYQADTKNIQMPLQNGNLTNCSNQNGKSQP